MESRKSKKTRSYGEASKISRDARSSLSPPAATSRPQLKDRVKSAPLVAQTARARQEKQSKHASTSVRSAAKGRQDVESPPPTPAYLLSPVLALQERPVQNVSASGQVRAFHRL